MPSKEELIKQLANEFNWTQADMRRALDASQENVNTREEAILCMMRYAGQDLKKRNYEVGAQKRINNQQKQQISGLVEQLTKIQNFYANQLVPSLRSTIQEQANYISDLLKQLGQDQGGKNG